MIFDQSGVNTKILAALREEIENRLATESVGLLIKAIEYFSAYYSIDDGFIKKINHQITRQFAQLQLEEKIGYLMVYLSNPNQLLVPVADRIVKFLLKNLPDQDLEALLIMNEALAKLSADNNTDPSDQVELLHDKITALLKHYQEKSVKPIFKEILINEFLFKFIAKNKIDSKLYEGYFSTYADEVFDAIKKGSMADSYAVQLLENGFTYFGGVDKAMIDRVNSIAHGHNTRFIEGNAD